MENWIGVAIWITMGAIVGLSMRVLVKLPDPQPGHTFLLAVFGSFGAVIGGMLGVGYFQFQDPVAISPGGMAGALFLSALLTWTYRWSCKGFV